MEEIEKPNYYAVLPADVRYDNNLSAREKLLYAEITALSNKEGYCWASNAYFANLYETTDRTIRTAITNLEKFGHLTRKLIYKKNSKEIEKRLLYPVKNFSGPQEKNFLTPGDENFLDNNTSVNTINNNKEEIYKEERSDKDKKFFRITLSHNAIDNIEEFTKVIQEWVDYKKAIKKPYKTQVGFNKFVKRLISLSDGEYEKAQDIIDISIANNYQGIFPLKGRG